MLAGKAATLISHALVFGFVLGLLGTCCRAQLQEEDKAKQFSGMTGEGGGAFFALRSCHQSLGGDGGEFFSPDYVCANPPLWCNWTIRAHAGMRVHLHLQDLTPDEDCHLKQDQIHVDEPPGPSAGHRVLRGCWHEATYTSRSDTLYVVLLIGGGPARQYRGFYARYRTFGPPMAYHPPDGISGQEGKRNSQIWDEFGAMIAVERELHPSATAAVFPLSDPPDKAADSSLEPDAHAPSWLETTPPSESPHGTSWAERGAPLMLSDPSDLARPSHELLNRPPGSSLHILNAKRRDADPGPNLPEGEQKTFEAGEKNMEAKETPTLSSPEEEPGWTLPHPNIVEPLSDHRGKLNVWNASQVLHEPGDRLFEVSVEVQLSQDHNQNQDHLDELLIKSVKALVLKHLDGLRIPLSLTFKRVKRLRAGCLYIMWLNAGRGRAHVYAGVHQDLHKLVGSAVARAGNLQHGVIASVSIGDVNECGTQLALCDVNADCLDQFGSYWCRCKGGFRDESHLGPRGTVCVERKPAGCTPGPSAETKAVYVLFFLLSSLLLTSLAAACALYRRHRRGAFLLAGRDSARADRGHAGPADSDLPPPPPPARGPRDAWTLQKVLARRVPGGGEHQRLPGHLLPLLRKPAQPRPHGALHPVHGQPGGLHFLSAQAARLQALGVQPTQRGRRTAEVLREVPTLHALLAGLRVQARTRVLLHLVSPSEPRGPSVSKAKSVCQTSWLGIRFSRALPD